ncbi:GNAT family N-acetyltransferase [Hanstruepera ponticola]|uniref:GNAT family N-acetyltransferase n=1 Tax=Hanstruepera ponticola TaxID=2042995 RepID=UPI000CF03E8A|nr:GNAT family N-acetyltransferase [Hanstruepera ponticola]
MFIELKTERLLLRALENHDVNQILFLRSDLVVNQFVERQKTKTKDEALEFIKRIQLSVSNEEVCYWSICLKTNSKLIGTICLWNFSKELNKAEVGYDLHPDFHGKGIMSEALRAVLEFGFQSLNLNQIDAYTQYDNLSSVYLLKKFGFKHQSERIDDENSKNLIFVLENRNLE